MTRTIVRLATILMLVGIVISACGTAATPAPAETSAPPPTTAPTEKPAVTYNFLLMGALVHPFYGPMPNGIADAAAKYGISPVPEFTMPQKFDIVEQFAIIDSHVAKGMNGLAFQPDDPAAANAKITDLQNLGISVVNIGGCPVLPSPSPFCLTTNTEELAYQSAKHLAEELGGKGNIVHFTGQLEDTNSVNSMNGVDRALKEYPGITLLKHVPGCDAGPDAAQSLVSSTFAAFGDEIDGVVATSGIATDVIANEFRKSGEQGIMYIGLNNFDVILQAIRDGFATGTMAQNPYGQAYLATYSLKLMTDGCKYTGKDFYVDTGMLYITKANIDKQAEELAKVTSDLAANWKENNFSCP